MEYVATVFLGETDPEIAAVKAEGIYAMLGPDFFTGVLRDSPEGIIDWIKRTLMREDLRVDFHDAKDAMLFKLTFG